MKTTSKKNVKPDLSHKNQAKAEHSSKDSIRNQQMHNKNESENHDSTFRQGDDAPVGKSEAASSLTFENNTRVFEGLTFFLEVFENGISISDFISLQIFQLGGKVVK